MNHSWFEVFFNNYYNIYKDKKRLMLETSVCFNVPIIKNLLYIEDQDLIKLINKISERRFNKEKSIIALLSVTTFTNTHLLYIDKFYNYLNEQDIKTLLNQSDSFKDQFVSLLTIKNLIGEKNYGS